MSSTKQRPRKQKRRQRNAQLKAKAPTRTRTFIQEPRKTNELRFLTRREVIDKVRLTYPSIWKKMRKGTFPRAHEMGPDKKIVWFAHEVEAWMFGLPIRLYLGETKGAKKAA